MNGVAVTRTLRQRGARTHILILTVHDEPQTVFGLLACGAVEYVLKGEGLERLVNAVRGETWLSPAIAGQVGRRAVARSAPETAEALSALTLREVEALRLIACGLDNTAIAQELVLTNRIVQNHINNI